MEKKLVKLHIKEIDESAGAFKGFAITFGVVDSYNDVTHKGAFKKTLKESKGQVAICRGHREWIGMGDFAEEQDKGLYVEGTLDINVNQAAREEFSLMKMAQKRKVPAGLSIGYDPIKYDYEDIDGGRVRNLREIALFEYSTTPPIFQAVPGAVVTGLKLLTDGKFDLAKAQGWLKENAEILNSLIVYKDLILDVTSREIVDALMSISEAADRAAKGIVEPDIHSMVKALDNALNKLRS